MRYLIILFLLCGSCHTNDYRNTHENNIESGDFLPLAKYYATRHDHNFEIWLKNNKNIAGIASFKKELSCPEEAHRK